MYSFTSFAMQLNELRKEMEGAIPQTDCRLRPDIRAMENGDIGNNCWPRTGTENKKWMLSLQSESLQCYYSNRPRQWGEEKGGGKTESRSQKPLQIWRRLEDEVSETGQLQCSPLLTALLNRPLCNQLMHAIGFHSCSLCYWKDQPIPGNIKINDLHQYA